MKQEFGDKTSGKSYWVLMTRDVILGSREKEYADQIQFVQHTAKHLSMPYTLPSILEGVVSTLCYHTETGEKLFGPLATLSQCKEKLSRQTRDQIFTVVFGKFADDGIEVKNSLYA